MTTDRIQEILTRARAEVRKIIIGQEAVIDHALICIFTGSHALVEGVPGVAKTLLVRTLARVLGGEFNRIQFTPDLMPTDITGTHIYNLAVERVLPRQRSHLHHLSPRRRNQPCSRENAKRPLAGHAGTPRHDRPRYA